MNLVLNTQAESALKNYCNLSGHDASTVINRLISKELTRYIPEEGFGQKATYIEGDMNLAKKVTDITGEKVRITETPCVVLGESTVFGKPYYRIFALGNVLKVPANKQMIQLETGEYL